MNVTLKIDGVDSDKTVAVADSDAVDKTGRLRATDPVLGTDTCLFSSSGPVEHFAITGVKIAVIAYR